MMYVLRPSIRRAARMAAAVCWLVTAFGSAEGAASQHGRSLWNGSGAHGGDGLRILFEKSRRRAIEILGELDTKADITAKTSDDVRDWLWEHRDELRDELTRSRLAWELEPRQATCAATDGESLSDVHLSFELCRHHATTLRSAGEVLVHEMVHHFGFGDDAEAFCDAVAIALFANEADRSMDEVGTWRALTDKSAQCMSERSELEGEGLYVSGDFVVALTRAEGTNELCLSRLDLVSGTWQDDLKGASIPFDDVDTATVVGDQLFVWGKDRELGIVRGALLDLKTLAWDFLPIEGQPVHRLGGSSFALGGRIVIYGGTIAEHPQRMEPERTGGIFDISERRWQPLEGPEEFVPYGRIFGFELGDRIGFWGYTRPLTLLHGGASYDTASGTWTELEAFPFSPNPYASHAIWTGRELLVWHWGVFSLELGGKWQLLGQPPMRLELADLAWTGSHLLAWGVRDNGIERRMGGFVFDVRDQTWRSIAHTSDGPRNLWSNSDRSIWTGEALFVWNGRSGRSWLYYPIVH